MEQWTERTQRPWNELDFDVDLGQEVERKVHACVAYPDSQNPRIETQTPRSTSPFSGRLLNSWASLRLKMIAKDLSCYVGTTEYYAQRAADFAHRHPSDPAPAVPYYLDYGHKYQTRFFALRPFLSVSGQHWVDTTHRALQQAIESHRTADPAHFAHLEANAAAFRAFCFSTHAQAYIEAGFCSLSWSDLWLIARTPDLRDLLSLEGMAQIVEVGMECVAVWVWGAWKTD